jgi:hypothetical protein
LRAQHSVNMQRYLRCTLQTDCQLATLEISYCSITRYPRDVYCWTAQVPNWELRQAQERAEEQEVQAKMSAG